MADFGQSIPDPLIEDEGMMPTEPEVRALALDDLSRDEGWIPDLDVPRVQVQGYTHAVSQCPCVMITFLGVAFSEPETPLPSQTTEGVGRLVTHLSP